MKHNLALTRSELFHSDLYGACPGFLQGLAWQEDKAGDVLVSKKTDMNAVVSVVGRVPEHGLYVGADGNFINLQYGTLATAKFLMHLAKPNGTPFAGDYDKVVSNLEKIQKQIATTPHCENLIVLENGMKKLRLTRSVFHKRVCRCKYLL